MGLEADPNPRRCSRDTRTLLVALSYLLVALAMTACADRPDVDKLNVVLVTLDTTRADRIGAFGGTRVPTPNFDRMAHDGVIFDSAISQVPLTLPAHGSILTGRYPATHGVRHNGIYKLPDEEQTLSEQLQSAGFRTAAFIGAYVLNAHYGLAQGFDTYDDIPTDRYEGGRDNLYAAQRTADEVNSSFFEWLDSRPEGRFFAWIHYYDPHLPYAPPERPGLSGTGYDREISFMDACFGDLIERLRSDDLLDRTLLVVVADHGESLGEHRELTHGIFLYEGVVRVPLFIRAPGLLPARATVSGPVELVDIAPTVLELLELPPLSRAEGRSLTSRIRGAAPDDAVAFAETLMPRIEFGWSELRMARDDRYKYIQAPRPEFYDLREDPGELRNLLSEEADRAAEMAELLDAWTARSAEGGSPEAAERTLSAEELARLQSLGYLGGGVATTSDLSGLPDPKDRIDEGRLLTEARDAMTAGRVEEALQTFEQLLAASPLNHLAHSSRLQALVRMKRLPEAESAAREGLDAALAERSASSGLEEKARRALASVLWMQGKTVAAETEYRRAVEINAADARAPVFGGLLLGAAGGQAEAMHIVEDVLSRNPDDGMALAARFELELAADRRNEALATAQRLVEVGAGDTDTLIRAGKLARDAGRLDLATALFGLADQRSPGDPDVLGHLGTAQLAVGDLSGAERALSTVRALRPRDPRAPFYLGNIALLRNDETSARRHFDESLALDPKFTAPLLNLARWLIERRRPDEAVALVEDALRRRPGEPEAQQLRAKLSSAR